PSTDSFEGCIIDRRGYKKLVAWDCALLKDEVGKIVGTLYSGIDISERRDVELALKQSEHRFRVALKNTPVSVTQQDKDLNYLWFYNANSIFSADDIIGKTDLDLFPQEEAQTLVQIKQETLQTGKGIRQEVVLHVNDEECYYDFISEPLHDDNDVVIGVISAATDITPYKQAEAAVQQEISLSQRLLQAMPHYFVSFNSDGKIVNINQHMLDVLHYGSKEAIGQDFFSTFVPKDEIKTMREAIEMGLENNTKVITTNHILKKDGDQLLIDWYSWPIFKDKNTLKYFFVLGVDHSQKEIQTPSLS
ncbi:MAG: PAS domain-containing protein, partial [Anaerolineae bacterium]|nr:PAS domain-containing protein [Anaerolineae bacterium]